MNGEREALSWRAAPLVWLFALAAVACALYAGWREAEGRGVVEAAARLVYMAAALAIIAWLTRGATGPGAPPVRRPWLELALLAVFLFWLALVLSQQVRRLDYSPYAVGYLGLERLLRADVAGPLNAALGWEGWPAARLNRLLLSLVTQFIVPLLPFVGLGYGARALGLRLHGWWLALPLSALTLVFAGLTGDITAPLARILPGILFQIGIVGLPEELWARSLLQTRLEAVWRNPWHGVAAAAVVYGLMFLPANVRLYGSDWPRVIAVCVGQQAVFGFVLGVLWRRTRSVAPGALWHAVIESLH